MAKNFRELRAGMSAGAKAVSAAEHSRLVEEMSLYQLRSLYLLKSKWETRKKLNPV